MMSNSQSEQSQTLARMLYDRRKQKPTGFDMSTFEIFYHHHMAFTTRRIARHLKRSLSDDERHNISVRLARQDSS